MLPRKGCVDAHACSGGKVVMISGPIAASPEANSIIHHPTTPQPKKTTQTIAGRQQQLQMAQYEAERNLSNLGAEYAAGAGDDSYPASGGGVQLQRGGGGGAYGDSPSDSDSDVSDRLTPSTPSSTARTHLPTTLQH